MIELSKTMAEGTTAQRKGRVAERKSWKMEPIRTVVCGLRESLRMNWWT
jgi:hypothetical protein